MTQRKLSLVWRKLLPNQPTRIVILTAILIALIAVEATYIASVMRKNREHQGPIVQKNIEYCGSSSAEQQLDLYVPASADKKPVPAVVYIHGGGWRSGYRGNKLITYYTSIFLRKGIAVADVGYRLKTPHRFPDQNNDVACALHHLTKYQQVYGIDMAKYVLFGDSAGGQLAASAALGNATAKYPYPKPSGVIDFYGVSDFRTIVAARRPDINARLYLGKLYLQEAEAASPVTMVNASAPPFLLVHGERDGVVPVAQSREFATRLHENGVRVDLYVIPGARHGFVGPELPKRSGQLLEQKMNQFLNMTLGAS